MFVELENDDQNFSTDTAANEVDEKLCSSVEYYATFRQKGTILCLSMIRVRCGTFHKLMHKRLDDNMHAYHGQYKTPRIVRKNDDIKLLLQNKL
ncbi:hypothetical protein ScPMuIL_016317 [Solemya velum]